MYEKNYRLELCIGLNLTSINLSYYLYSLDGF